MVVAAVGLTAAMLQFHLRGPEPEQAWHPLARVLNLIGIGCAAVALFADFLRLTPRIGKMTALAAVVSFALSGAIILHRSRRPRATKK